MEPRTSPRRRLAVAWESGKHHDQQDRRGSDRHQPPSRCRMENSGRDGHSLLVHCAAEEQPSGKFCSDTKGSADSQQEQNVDLQGRKVLRLRITEGGTTQSRYGEHLSTATAPPVMATMTRPICDAILGSARRSTAQAISGRENPATVHVVTHPR